MSANLKKAKKQRPAAKTQELMELLGKGQAVAKKEHLNLVVIGHVDAGAWEMNGLIFNFFI